MSTAAYLSGRSVSMNRLAEKVASQPWEYVDADTQYLTHNIHRYSGKFIPQIAARAISLITDPGETVLDPYCGSGTTLLEAALLRRRAIGIDLSPLAVLIAQTKTRPVPEAQLRNLQDALREKLVVLSDQDALPLFPSVAAQQLLERVERDPRSRDDWFQKWFQPGVLQGLLAIDHAIVEIADDSLRNVARVAFSDILRKSSNAHSGYPNVMFDRKAPAKARPVRPFLKALERVCDMVARLSEVDASWSDVRVERGDARDLPLEEDSVDAIVSHPPYIGSIPYAEYGVLSLKWLGADPNHLDRRLTGGRRQSRDVVDRFRAGYGGMLQEAMRVLRPGRYMFLLVGNPLVKGETVDLAKMTLDLAGEAGFQVTARAQRSGINRRANKMGAEHLLFFRKPPLSRLS